jgi:hypothetical protein
MLADAYGIAADPVIGGDGPFMTQEAARSVAARFRPAKASRSISKIHHCARGLPLALSPPAGRAGPDPRDPALKWFRPSPGPRHRRRGRAQGRQRHPGACRRRRAAARRPHGHHLDAAAYDVTVRWGGDEFVCALYDASLEVASHRVADIQNALEALRPGASISAGLALLADDDTLESAIARADSALYRSKANRI